MMTSCDWIVPDWPVAPHIKALTTLRGECFDLSLLRPGASSRAVIKNRQQLSKKAGLPSEAFWLNQVHGTQVAELFRDSAENKTVMPLRDALMADASITFDKNVVCAVLTADCLPILLCNDTGSCVGAVHAGWRGLAAGIIEKTVEALSAKGQTAEGVMAWLGPAIGPSAFEVGEEVVQAFRPKGIFPEDKAVRLSYLGGIQKWFVNLYELARERLKAKGVHRIFGGKCCTYNEWPRFFSFRRNPEEGRMATLIWLE